jgi:hypothetical protein
VNLTERPWFRVERRPAKQAGPRWRASATILRADTDEPVERLAARAPTPDEAEKELDAALGSRLAALEKPSDWGRDPTVPRLVQRYLRLRDEVYGMVQEAEGRAEPDARALVARAKAYDRDEMTKLRQRVEALTEAQRVELATPTPEQLADADDPWVLDLLTARSELCRFIPRPSPAVQAGREQLARALDRQRSG